MRARHEQLSATQQPKQWVLQCRRTTVTAAAAQQEKATIEFGIVKSCSADNSHIHRQHF